LKDNGKSLITHYSTTYAPPVANKGASRQPVGKTYFTALTQNEDKEGAKASEETDKGAELKGPAEEKPAGKTKPEETKPEDGATAAADDAGGDNTTGGDTKTGDSQAETPANDVPMVTSTIKIGDSTGTPEAISQAEMVKRVEDASKKLEIANPKLDVNHASWDRDPASRLPEWNVSLATSPDDAERIMREVSQQLNSEPVWPASKKIGGQIAGDFVKIAIGALLASILGIILYIWFRFQNVTWGFAAVVALVHDVLFMLAGISVSYWLQNAPAFTGLTEFKIDLTVIAAFLTLIGYSINDTIVIFDRMREIKGKLPTINRQIVNDSVNQTLSRSILTFVTVFVTVVVLYFWGGPGIHAFAYAMLIGTVVGMYSTVFIAAPFLLWMLNRGAPAKKAA
jgi:SecD/SecF fusion protein